MSKLGVLIDTNAYSAFKQAEPNAVEIIRRIKTLAFCPTVLGELLGGFEVGSKTAYNRRELSRFIDSPRVHLLRITEETANYYARIYAALRQQGTPIPTNDMWIAASALLHGYALFSYDTHFRCVSGLVTGRNIEDFIV